MRKALALLLCLLSGATAFAQEYADRFSVSRTVAQRAPVATKKRWTT